MGWGWGVWAGGDGGAARTPSACAKAIPGALVGLVMDVRHDGVTRVAVDSRACELGSAIAERMRSRLSRTGVSDTGTLSSMAKRYFEFVEGTSSKFWEIWIEGAEVRTRHGRIGAAGQTTVKDQASAAAAKKLHDSLVAEKTKKRYVEAKAGAVAEPAPKAAAPKAAGPEAGSIDAAVARIEAKAKAAKVALGKGASDEAIATAQKVLGFALPEAVQAFYRRHDGAEQPAVAGRELLSLERMLGEWTIWKQLLDGGTFGDNDHGEPGPGVQKKWWIPQWVPVTYDGLGDLHAEEHRAAAGSLGCMARDGVRGVRRAADRRAVRGPHARRRGRDGGL